MSMMMMGTSAACCQPAFWVVVFLASLLTLGVLGLLAGLVVAAWHLWAVHSAIRALPTTETPPTLLDAARSAGLRGVNCIDSATADAFCAGALRPGVYVTTGLLQRLDAAELQAVLAHEAAHARRRDPLRRALARGVALSFFFVPLVRWWSRHDLEQSEVKADRRAIERVGRKPLAAALWRLDGEGGLSLTPAFGGAAELRVAQILGDPVPRRGPSPWIWLLSAAGLTGFAYLLFCPVAGLLSQ